MLDDANNRENASNEVREQCTLDRTKILEPLT